MPAMATVVAVTSILSSISSTLSSLTGFLSCCRRGEASTGGGGGGGGNVHSDESVRSGNCLFCPRHVTAYSVIVNSSGVSTGPSSATPTPPSSTAAIPPTPPSSDLISILPSSAVPIPPKIPIPPSLCSVMTTIVPSSGVSMPARASRDIAPASSGRESLRNSRRSSWFRRTSHSSASPENVDTRGNQTPRCGCLPWFGRRPSNRIFATREIGTCPPDCVSARDFGTGPTK